MAVQCIAFAYMQKKKEKGDVVVPCHLVFCDQASLGSTSLCVIVGNYSVITAAFTSRPTLFQGGVIFQPRYRMCVGK